MITNSKTVTRKSTAILALLLLFGAVVSCRMVESLTGGEKAGTVTALWPDVPPFAGATKAARRNLTAVVRPCNLRRLRG